MNVGPVLIDDDDDDDDCVYVTDPVVIIDDDEQNNKKTVEPPTVETIDLDDETSINTGSVNAAKIVSSQSSSKKSEASFINNLRNNRLMDKIVTHCINIENASGMPRVIYKTLLPLYRDTAHTFKESESLRSLLKKTYKLLIRDPDHKFLHIKTLCEELKSGGLRRKVPFVTLATNVKNNGSQEEFKELTSSSRNINQNENENRLSHPVNERVVNTSHIINKRTVNKSKRKGSPVKRKSKYIKSNTIGTKNRMQKKIAHIEKEKADIINLDDSENESVEVNSSRNDGPNDVITIENSNKENNDKNENSSGNEMDYELLIPQNRVDYLAMEKNKEQLIAKLEKQIAFYKPIIDSLEEAEVTSECPYSSPYNQCAKFKQKVVQIYKKICAIKGDCANLVKRREIRLHVAEGHPPGPAKALEQLLNSTIDRTGAVEFPDFSDVVNCVVHANVSDSLGWSRQQIIEEAIALFRKCGQELRKRRQQREYRDLLGFVRNKDPTDDPADKDPILSAKLEENKQIAKFKEEEIFERYVNLENNACQTGVNIPNAGNSVSFEEDKDSSDSDSENEQNVTLPNYNITVMNNQPMVGEKLSNKNNLFLVVTPLTLVTSALAYNQCVRAESSKSNGVTNSNLNDTLNPSSTVNPMLRQLLNAPQDRIYLQGSADNNDQCLIRESSKMNEVHNNTVVELTTNTRSSNSDAMRNESAIPEGSTEKVIDSKLDIVENNEISSTDITMKSVENTGIAANNEANDDIQNNVSITTNEGVKQNCDSSISKDSEVVKVKIEDYEKKKPLDIQNMLDELGSSFVCQVFDIEDPFLVIEISSDDFTDDDEL